MAKVTVASVLSFEKSWFHQMVICMEPHGLSVVSIRLWC